MAKKNTATQTQAQDQTQQQAASAELIALTTLPLIEYVTKAGEARKAVRLHSVSYLPEKIGEDGKVQTARFGGFLGEWSDPATGEVYGLNRDSVALQFFGHAAEELKSIIDHLADPKRDAILLAVNGAPETLFASVHRDATGRVKQLAVGTREFRGNFKKLIAAPEAVIIEE